MVEPSQKSFADKGVWINHNGTMIGRLTGALVETANDNTIIVDVAGVGYELIVPSGTIGRLVVTGTQESSGLITLYVHTQMKENALELFGFSSLQERRAFRVLITISGIGPRVAVAILSSLPSAQLARCIQAKNTQALTAVVGIGKKLAERMVLELHDKLSFALTDDDKSVTTPSAPADAPVSSVVQQQVIDALVRMGFRTSDAQRAVTAIGHQDAVDLSSLFRQALALLRT